MSIEAIAPTGWTDFRVERLTALWAEGLSASQIAADLGGVTRNAVLGKVDRLGIAATAPEKKPHKFGGNRLSNEEAARRQRERALAKSAEEDVDPVNENIIPLGQRCSLLELNDEKCHWPIGDPGQPDFFFCGGKTSAGIPYCGYHCRVAYQPPAARRDRQSIAR